MKHSTVFDPRIIRIAEIVFLSLFIISLFLPYVFGVKPKEFFWDIWSDNIPIWPLFFIIGLPLILSFLLFILILVKPGFGKRTLKLVTWFIMATYSFITVVVVVEAVENIEDPVLSTSALVFSLFLFILTIIKSKDNYLKIENCILSIITLPVALCFFSFFELEFGGYLLNISFIVLYVTAVLKVFMLNSIEETLNPKI